MIDQYVYDVADGLPAIASFPRSFVKLRRWLKWCDLQRIIARLEANSSCVTMEDGIVPPGWLALQLVQRDGRLWLDGMIREPDELASDVVAAGFFLLAVAAATGRGAGGLLVHCALGEELPTEPLTPVRVELPSRGVAGLASLRWEHFRFGRLAA